MNHKKFQNKIILYLDGDLGEDERIKMQEHLKVCSLCNQHVKDFSKVWKLESVSMRKKPSPYLWTRLEKRIEEYNYYNHFLSVLMERINSLVQPVAFFLLIIIAVFIGNYLGDVSLNNVSENPPKEVVKEIVKIYHIEAFELFTPESISEVMNISSGAKKSEGMQ